MGAFFACGSSASFGGSGVVRWVFRCIMVYPFGVGPPASGLKREVEPDQFFMLIRARFICGGSLAVFWRCVGKHLTPGRCDLSVAEQCLLSRQRGVGSL